MTKAAKKGAEPRVADQIIQGLKEALAFARGEQTGVRVDRVLVTSRHASAPAAPVFTRSRIIDLRTKRMGLSQDVFASAMNVSRDTVRAWEQGRNVPGGPALRLLEIADEHPDIILGRVQLKSSDEERKCRTDQTKPVVIQDVVTRLASSPKVTAAKRNPSGLKTSGAFKQSTGVFKGIGAVSTKKRHVAGKPLKVARKK